MKWGHGHMSQTGAEMSRQHFQRQKEHPSAGWIEVHKLSHHQTVSHQTVCRWESLVSIPALAQRRPLLRPQRSCFMILHWGGDLGLQIQLTILPTI